LDCIWKNGPGVCQQLASKRLFKIFGVGMLKKIASFAHHFPLAAAAADKTLAMKKRMKMSRRH